jgi:hypothetical protein
MFLMFFRLFFFCLLTITNVAAAPHQLPKSAITRRFADGSGRTDVRSITSIAGTLDGNGNGNGDNGNGNTNGENGNDNGHNANGDLSGNTIIIPRTVNDDDSLTTLTGVLSGDGNGSGGNGNDNTNGENGNDNGHNANGDLSDNTIIIPRTVNGDSLTTLTGVLSGDGNGNGGNGNGNTNGENADNNGNNLNGDASGNTIFIGRTVDISSALTGVESADGNGNGGNGNDDTNGKNGNNGGHNGNGDLSGNTVT